jgi:hypothetical protein
MYRCGTYSTHAALSKIQLALLSMCMIPIFLGKILELLNRSALFFLFFLFSVWNDSCHFLFFAQFCKPALGVAKKIVGLTFTCTFLFAFILTSTLFHTRDVN